MVGASVVLVFFIALISCVAIQFFDNKKNAQNSCALMVSQLKKVITENEENIRELQDALKEEYLIRADVASSRIDENPDSFSTPEKFLELAKLLKVDEIHLFDKTGKIVSGSIPKYYGYNFESGSQMGFFKPMLKNKELSLCQNVTPNTAEAKPMMYAMVWNHAKTQLVQIGVTPERLLERMRESRISSLVRRMPVTKGMTIFVIDDNQGKIIASTDNALLNSTKYPGGKICEVLEKKQSMQITAAVNKKQSYITYERMGNFDLAVAYEVDEANENLPASFIQFVLILVVAFGIILIVTRKYIRSFEKQGEALAEANAAKSVFLSRMSHDIRTPLNGILGLLEILERNKNNKELLDSNRKKAKIAAEHLLSLLSDTLEVVKLEDNRVTLSHESFDLLPLIKTVTIMAEIKAVEFSVTIQDKSNYDVFKNIIFYGSPLHVRQILLNIIDNAIKYNKKNGKVSLFTELISKKKNIALVRFTIQDTGIGMSEEFLKHIFEPFSQEHSDARSVFKGTGLGMSIVNALIDKMHGELEIQSEENQGSQFIITIPFEVTEGNLNTKIENPEDNELKQNISGVKILLVEDNELNREIAETLLQECGAIITSAENGKIAVDQFKENEVHTFDLILMDLMMPVMNGIDAAKEIRKMNKADAKTIPIVALSANAYEENVEESKRAGMNAHIAKPFKIEELVKVISQLVMKN